MRILPAVCVMGGNAQRLGFLMPELKCGDKFLEGPAMAVQVFLLLLPVY